MRKVALGLSLAMIFAMPWEDSLSFAGLGTLTRMIGLFMAAVWLLAVLIYGRLRRWRLFHVALWLFVLWNVVSAFWSLDIAGTQMRIATYVQIFVLVMILWDLYVTPAILRAGLQAYCLGGWVSIIGTIINYRAGREIAVYSGGRFTATGMSPGDMVLMLALSLPAAWFLASTAGKGKMAHLMRWVNYAYVPAALFAIALSATRMGLFAVVPGVFYILITTARLKLSTRILIFAVLLGCLLALPLLIPQSAIARLSTTADSIESADLNGRVDLWRAAFAQFSGHPVLGIGSGAFRAVVEAHTVVHNTFLSVLTETGLVGFALFSAILAIVVYQALHQPSEYSRLWLVALIIWSIGVSVQTWEHTKSTWLFLSLVIVSASLPWAAREAAKDSAAIPRSMVDPDLLEASHAR